MTRTVPTLEEIRGWPATVPVPLACSAIGISKSHGYSLLKSGEFPCRTIPLRGVHRVVTASLIALLAADQQEVA